MGEEVMIYREEVVVEEDRKRKMDREKAQAEASKRPPGHGATEVLHQRKSLPYSYTTMAVTGLAITAAIGYTILYAKKKPEANARDVAKVSAGVAQPQDTHPRK
ncbi:uncharacterized protein LOC106763730 [Vigna radiata var. radiata]|uniref:Uncharacterized protein LOC106763730 n=1 Tax=Vigna radiata var. radiata TaxID=3916 RepID=A0A1S3UBI2_VIGRR|nr:uncharacterized protein LOC106763730 [Vigna radiata var. radiata]